MHDRDDKRCVLTLTLPDELATLALGASLAAALKAESSPRGPVIYLEGDLGAGKTTLVRGLLRALGYEGKVKSPTYTFVEPYAISNLNLYHFDFYRFEHAEEYLDGGFEEYFGNAAVCLVEWPDKAVPYLPPADLRVCLDVVGEGRCATLYPVSAEGLRCLTSLHLDPLPDANSSSSLPQR